MSVTRRELSVLVPVLLIDEVLPDLKDTELRVLLVVLRQTAVQGREASSAWLTHGELCRRTGRASEAVSVAVDSLTKRGFLLVRDEAGSALMTAAARQSRTGKRFYQVRFGVTAAQSGSAHDPGKAKTIEEHKEIYGFRNTGQSFARLRRKATPEDQLRIEQEKQRIRERLHKLPKYP